MPMLHGICPKADIRTTGPLRPSIAEKIGKCTETFRELRIAIEFAFTLIPQVHESQPFFSESVRHIMAMVIFSFILSGVEWSLAPFDPVLKSDKPDQGGLETASPR